MCNQPVRTSFVSGWPPREYFFTGQWEGMPRASSRRIARRNNPTVYHPVYEAEDGERVVDPTVTRKINPTLPIQLEAANE